MYVLFSVFDYYFTYFYNYYSILCHVHHLSHNMVKANISTRINDELHILMD